jgi:hypothetical protein
MGTCAVPERITRSGAAPATPLLAVSVALTPSHFARLTFSQVTPTVMTQVVSFTDTAPIQIAGVGGEAAAEPGTATARTRANRMTRFTRSRCPLQPGPAGDTLWAISPREIPESRETLSPAARL